MYSNPSYDNDFYRSVSDTQLITDIQQAIHAEYSAIACYEKLAQMAPSQEERDKIQEIQNDEKRHLEEFSSIYYHFTGGELPLIKSSSNVQTIIKLVLNSPLKMNKRR
ncbi:hypothetical protein JCM21714_3893 [Gracilibacillus boraciitolerans JCM 21714]|uniref:Uncharacterized protein n=1 Tax=Gracilibacillus boraciitolerans JCM 21714 TaxID=1298598 RepID=W4VNH5_9BACI|nr:hypothetical protein JCM21714_3893 [Gracilibacillus boraciitolerans JCM 21714]